MSGSTASIRKSLGQQSSLEALSRTIEGLEARIEGLVARQSANRTAQTAEAVSAAPPVDEPDFGDGGAIVRRQRLLERERANLQARLEARRSSAPAARLDEAPPASGSSVREIANALVELRGELKRDVDTTMTRELQALRDEIRTFGEVASSGSLPTELRHDLKRLADCIERLGVGAVPADAKELREEFDLLREMIEGLASQSALTALERQWHALSGKLDRFEPETLIGGLSEIADRLAHLRDMLAELPASAPADELGEELRTVAAAIEALARQGRLDDELTAQRFGELTERLDEISRAIVIVGAKADRTQDDENFARFDSRLDGLSRQIDDLFDRDLAGDLAARVEALSESLDDIARESSVTHLGTQLDGLAALLARPDQGDLSQHLQHISERIDEIDAGTVSGPLADRLDDLARRIDTLAAATERFEATAFERLDAMAEHGIGSGLLDTTALEARLAEVVRHLETTQKTSTETDGEILEALEARLGELAEMMRGAPASAAGGELEPRLAAIEEHLATNDDFVIEAARQAAETVVEAYGRGATTNGGGINPAELAALSGLAEDLRALEQLSQRSEQRNARAFDAVHDTLLRIAAHLENLEPVHAEVPAEAARDATPSVAEVQPESRPVSATPAEAAAEAAAFAVREAEDEVEEKAVVEPASSGFLAGLGRRMRPAKAAPEAARQEPVARTDVDDAPSIDPSESFAGFSANEPLEPGSGAPDIGRILQKVRNAQRVEGSERTSAETEQAEFIAAARRAAQAAAAEAEAIGRGKSGRTGRGLADILKQRRRPILMAVGAVLVVLMSLPLVSALRAPHSAEVAATAAPLAHPQAKSGLDIARAAAGAKPQTPSIATGTVDPGASGNASGPAGSAPVDKAPPAAQHSSAAASAPLATPATTEPPASTPLAAAKPEPTSMAKASQASPADATGTAVAALPQVPAEIGPNSLRDAAAKGEPAALFEIGSRYNDGRGVATDLAKAATWYKAAAERGLAPAEYRLGNLYEKGTGVDRDVKAAEGWYEKAAAAGNASAMHNLAVLYAMGDGAAADFDAAAKWFTQAAERGVKDSQFNLGILYAQGHGVPRDLAQSYKWFALAASGGDKDATEKRDAVSKALKSGELDAMKSAVKAWKPKPLDPAANSVPVAPEWAGTDTKTSSIDMTRAVRNIQAILDNNGFDAGKPDGVMGARTKAAIKAFQKSIGQQATGEIDDALIKELLDLNAKQASKAKQPMPEKKG